MQTTYLWEDAGESATRMTLRNRGAPAGFAALPAALMRRANDADLRCLKALLAGQA